MAKYEGPSVNWIRFLCHLNILEWLGEQEVTASALTSGLVFGCMTMRGHDFSVIIAARPSTKCALELGEGLSTHRRLAPTPRL